MAALIHGSFTAGQFADPGNVSDVLNVPLGTTTARLTLTGLDASNTVKTQKSTNNGASWVDQTTYNSDQALVGVTVAANEQWRLVNVAIQALKTIRFKFSAES